MIIKKKNLKDAIQSRRPLVPYSLVLLRGSANKKRRHPSKVVYADDTAILAAHQGPEIASRVQRKLNINPFIAIIIKVFTFYKFCIQR